MTIPTQLPLIIVNPASAAGSTGRKWPALAVDIRKHFGPFNCILTTKPGDAERIAAEESRMGRKFILACGGDGTISEVANGILSTGEEVELGLLPRGTGGDFRKTLGLPGRIEDAALALNGGETRRIDVGEVTYINNQGSSETRYFINVASFGMGGEVVKRAESSSKTFGGAITFALATVTTTFSYSSPEVWLKAGEEEERRFRIVNVSVANGRYFGGGMKIAPEAKLDDRLFDVIVVKSTSKFEIIANVHRLYKGTHLTLPQITSLRSDRIEARPVDPDKEIRIEVDGEPLGRLPASFRISPKLLMVRCPRNHKDTKTQREI
jgi:diacylglycerol kinase (ATP)